ncbi:MAG: PQQ-like beta-propeller repeat protein [Bacteroidales bacterium]|nr:PQQ-like beta-propeller repeat protein [Bacteroidales bacterium]
MILFTFIIFSFYASPAVSQESHEDLTWHQWMGPRRDGTWSLDLEKNSLAASDLEKKWEVPVGTGYSGPTVAKGKVYVMDYVGETLKYERVLCFDAKTGDQIWIHQYECLYSVGYPTGPRASVLIDEGRAYSFGTMGDLYCLDACSGKVLWHVDGKKDYNASIPIWGLSSSPLVEHDLLIIQMGGTPDGCLVAFEKNSGKEVWKALSDNASYSSPIVIEQAGKRVLVCWTGDNVAGLNPSNGEIYWKIPFDRRKEVINIPTPVYSEPYLFLSSFYDGSMLITLDEKTQAADLVWKRVGENERKTDALHCCISTPIIQDGYIYGIDSYGEFRCLDLKNGNRIWTDSTLVPYSRWANAHLIKQGEKIWAFNELGELILGKLSPSGFKDMGRHNLIQPVRVSPNPRGGVNWAHPAFSGRKIYARSDAMLVCYEILE